MGSRAFAYTGGWQKWKVPRGVKYANFTLHGAGSNGTAGGRVSGRVSVTPGSTLFLAVGGAGRAPTGSTGGAATFGGGGKGGNGSSPGWSGGGATAIRVASTTGVVKAVAAGAGGSSGGSGKGGRGGVAIGENGWPGAGANDTITISSVVYPLDTSVGNATGGTQTQGGFGGTSAGGSALQGGNASAAVLGPAGAGASRTGAYGGGGGGGGYRSGGGGQAGDAALAPPGGGGGGSNYSVGVIGASSLRGAGGMGNGSISLSWTDPPPADQPPSPPTEAKIAGYDIADELITRSTNQVTVSAKVDDPDAGQQVRLVVRLSPLRDFSSHVRDFVSSLTAQTNRAAVTVTGLSQDTLYYVRLYARDAKGRTSTTYRSTSFWSNQHPTEPILNTPADGNEFSQLTPISFNWSHQDPDPNSAQAAWQMRWRTVRTVLSPAGPWTTVARNVADDTYLVPGGTFLAATDYEWTVRTKDTQGAWGPFAIPSSFRVTGTSLAPTLSYPARGEAVDTSVPVPLSWAFRSPSPGATQFDAQLRYRVVGTPDWLTQVDIGSDRTYLLDTDTLVTGKQYEWQVRTQATVLSTFSDWSPSGHFWTVYTPGVGGVPEPLHDLSVEQGPLGIGLNRAYIYDQGGMVMRGELRPLDSINWNRKRDDISNCVLTITDIDGDMAGLLQQVSTWRHEIVVFRDGQRVWEGPITLIEDQGDGIKIEAKDVMAWVYRRIMRQGYNDAYRITNGVEVGSASVVERATQIVMNALAPFDPNILRYLTSFNFPDDAGQSRVVPDFSKMAWEEVDDMGATAGLDYTTVGRRIMIWDTHRPIGRLPEMRNEHFSDTPIITEYGMQLATAFGVTNNNGIYGVVEKDASYYGPVEQLASAYGESEGGAEDTLSSVARAALERTLTDQATRNIGGRFPAPVVVRVPDNSTLHPDTLLDVNHLVPGVWIPLRAKGAVREVSQWQKLDAVSVTATAEGEQIQVTMSPAPNAGQDPDAESAAEEE